MYVCDLPLLRRQIHHSLHRRLVVGGHYACGSALCDCGSVATGINAVPGHLGIDVAASGSHLPDGLSSCWFRVKARCDLDCNGSRPWVSPDFRCCSRSLPRINSLLSDTSGTCLSDADVRFLLVLMRQNSN